MSQGGKSQVLPWPSIFTFTRECSWGYPGLCPQSTVEVFWLQKKTKNTVHGVDKR